MRSGRKLSIRLDDQQRQAVEQLARRGALELRQTVHVYHVTQAALFIAFGIEPQDGMAKRLSMILTRDAGDTA